MSTVSITNYAAGEPIVAADVNADFAGIGTSTALLTGENTRTEWCSRYHIDEFPATRVFNRDFGMIENSAATQVINTNTWAQVNLGGSFRVTPLGGWVLEPGQVLRAHFDVNVMAVVLDPGLSNFNPVANNSQDCYQFSFWIQDGSLQTRKLGCTSTYSTGIRSDLFGAFGKAMNSMSPYLRIGQRCNHTLCYVNNTGSNVTINYLEVRARIYDTTWVDSITLQYGTFTYFTGRY